jgi:pimeloyl-ACP methyl ester carboxylesterase
MDSVEVDGLDIGYERVGAGPQVVLVHGYVGDGPSVWRPQLDALADDFTLIAWDAPGAGSSSDPPEDLGMAGFADYLAGFIDALGLDHPHLVGSSFGGALLLELHRRHPAVGATLTLVSGYAGWGGSLPPATAEQRLQQALELADLAPTRLVDALLPTMFSPTTQPELIEEFRASLLATHPIGFRAMAKALAQDLRSALASVNVPTLLVYGDNDTRAPMTVAQAMHDAIPGSKLVILPGAGHVCNIDAPDDFNQALRAFLLDPAAPIAGGPEALGAP